MKKKILSLLLALVLCMGLCVAPASATAFLESKSEYIWLNPEAEAYHNTMISSASRLWHNMIASANGDYVVKGGISDYTGVPDSDKAQYRSGEWSISLGDIADDGFANNDFLAKVKLSGRYFGRNAFRNSALTDLTFDHMHTEGVQSSRGYFRARADYQQICWGRSGVIFEDYAFADCKNLTSVVFASEPKDLYLAPTAFTGCPNLTITAPAGGLIEAHCRANGINFIGYGTIERQPHAYEYLEPFTDILSTDEPAEAVAWAVENGITKGTSATTFSPCGFVTRAETVTFLWRMAGSPKAGNVDNPFTDVSSGAWYYDAVMWAVKNGVTNGTSATTFSPNTRVNRAQVIQFLYNYAGKPELASSSAPHIYNINNHYGSEEGSWYYKAACWAYQNKMLVDGTKFFPNAPCQRALMVQYLYNYFKSDPNALKKPGGGEITYIGPFIDVTMDSPYADAIKWAYDKGLTQDVQDFETTSGVVNGIGQDTRGPKFYPDEKLYDVQFAQIMYNRAGRPTVTNQSEIEEKGVMQDWYWTDIWDTTTYYKAHWWFIDAFCWTINENYGLFKLGNDGNYTYASSCTYKDIVTTLYEQAGKPDITGMENPLLWPAYRSEDCPLVWAYDMGLITRDEARNYNAACSRSRLFQILYTLDNKPAAPAVGDDIAWASKKKLMKDIPGIDAAVFDPDAPLTRAQFVQVLYNQAGRPGVQYSSYFAFKDVPKGTWYTSAIYWAASERIIKNIDNKMDYDKTDSAPHAIDNGNFGPDELCTRAQAATTLYNQAGCPSVNGMANPFADVPAGQWYTDAVIWAYNTGLMDGINATKFEPNATCTCGQLVTALYNQAGKPAV